MISVVVPVWNDASGLERCLAALDRSEGLAWECIVVDDASTDESAAVAERHGARVLRLPENVGPGQARNAGARIARAPLLCFLDADVLVKPSTLVDFFTLFTADPDLTAAFGSYDATPAAAGLVSEYRNLLHHFTHQQGHEDASTFWAGCGAIKRVRFLELGGFDADYGRPQIEDIELGYRLRGAGDRIRLAKHVQVTHTKHWTLWRMLRTDFCDRALPWTRLIVDTGNLPNDLNVGLAGRLSAVCAWLLPLLAVLAGRWRRSLLALPLPAIVLLACNWRFYALLWQAKGAWFATRAIPLHWLYFAYSSLAFATGSAYFAAARRLRGRSGGEARS
jgi:glycosyltransferase involved in cell wall biosynthesis